MGYTLCLRVDGNSICDHHSNIIALVYTLSSNTCEGQEELWQTETSSGVGLDHYLSNSNLTLHQLFQVNRFANEKDA